MAGIPVTVLKNGAYLTRSDDQLASGDVIILQVGDIVPADILLIEVNGMEVDEFEITGEVLPVIKSLEEENNLLHMGSKVTRGRGKGVVVAVGSSTEYGKLLRQRQRIKKPEEVRIFKKKYLGITILLLPAFLIGLVNENASLFSILHYVVFSVLLILLQNNELYFQLITSWKTSKFRKAGIYLQDNGLLDHLNDIDYFCFDKTGVLTSRQLEVRGVFTPDKKNGEFNPLGHNTRSSLIGKASALCNDVHYLEKIGIAHPVDQAFIRFAEKIGIDVPKMKSAYELIYEEPFDSEERMMVSGFQTNQGEILFFSKGDPEVILRKCSHYMTADGKTKYIDYKVRQKVRDQLDRIFQKSATAIAVSYYKTDSPRKPANFIFLFLAQLESPIEPYAEESIHTILQSGKRALLLTGDRIETALSVADEIGISGDQNGYLTGKMIAKMAVNEVVRQSEYCSVFARLMPSQKAVLIRLFQQKGHRTLMIGDGPNDSIAIKVADIGISFHDHSSPIARKFAKILINDLSEFLDIFNNAIKTRHLIQFTKVARILIILTTIFYSYFLIIPK